MRDEAGAGAGAGAGPAQSLFARLVLLISLLLAIGAAGLTMGGWYYAKSAADETYDRLLVGAALQIAEAMTVREGAIAVELPVSAFQVLALAERDRIFYEILDTEGRFLTGYSDLSKVITAWPTGIEPHLASGTFMDQNVRLAVAGRAFSDPAVFGTAYVIVAQTTEARHGMTQDLTGRVVALVLAMSAIAIGGVVFAVKYALRPLRRLEEALRARDPNDLTPLSINLPQELRPLAGSINYFMGRLKKRVALLQNFVSDVAHQIRTPLTALSAQIDILAREPSGDSGRRHLDRVQARTAELARLANQLLSHAMVIHRTDDIPFERVDVLDVVRRALRDAVPDTLERDVRVEFSCSQNQVFVLGDKISLREAFTNIIDNAIEHGAPTLLKVGIAPADDQVAITVEDDGPGIAPEMWPEVVERFNVKTAGGLGFAIAAEVTRAHHGTLSFRARGAGEAFAVILRLPAFKESRP